MNQKVINFLKEYWFFIVIGALLLFFLEPRKEPVQSGIEGNSKPAIVKNTKYKITSSYNDDLYSGKNTVTIRATDFGYDLVDASDVVVGSLNEEDDIINFVSALQKGREYSISQTTPDSISSGRKASIIFDNTYSYRNKNLDTTLPEKRLEQGVNYLRTNGIITDGTYGKLGRLFSLNYGTPEVQMNDEVFSYKIDASRFPLVIIPHRGRNVEVDYVAKLNKMNLYDIVLELGYSDIGGSSKGSSCIYTSTYDFVCYSVEEFFNEIKSIYQEKYASGDEKHYGTFLLDYLFTKGFYNSQDVYVFTDGEFQISKETAKAYLGGINSSYKQQQTLGFDANSYDTNMSWVGKYREHIGAKLQEHIIPCNGQAIHLIGITSDSAPFINYAKSFYEGLFTGCTVGFK